MLHPKYINSHLPHHWLLANSAIAAIRSLNQGRAAFMALLQLARGNHSSSRIYWVRYGVTSWVGILDMDAQDCCTGTTIRRHADLTIRVRTTSGGGTFGRQSRCLRMSAPTSSASSAVSPLDLFHRFRWIPSRMNALQLFWAHTSSTPNARHAEAHIVGLWKRDWVGRWCCWSSLPFLATQGRHDPFNAVRFIFRHCDWLLDNFDDSRLRARHNHPNLEIVKDFLGRCDRHTEYWLAKGEWLRAVKSRSQDCPEVPRGCTVDWLAFTSK